MRDKCPRQSLIEKGDVTQIRVSLETRDFEGSNVLETHYDLLTLTAVEKDSWVADSVCIPIPVLSTISAVTAMKDAVTSEHRQHFREAEEDINGEYMSSLWEELLAAIPARVIWAIIEKYLDRSSYNLNKLKSIMGERPE
ncbi:MAG: hypothetical protein V4467_05070 [Patescibacteria group bacterium]